MVIQAKIYATQILYENFVCNLFHVFKDLCGYTLSHEQLLGAIHNLFAHF